MQASIRNALAGSALLMACLSASAADDLPQALPPAEEAVALAWAEHTGRQIFEHDRAAAVASDAVQASESAHDDIRVSGWVTEARDDGIAVTFVDAAPAALYRVLVSESGEAGPVAAYSDPEPLSAYEAAAVAARDAAVAVPFERCAERYNPVVLPAAADAAGRWTVYLLPATTRHDEVPVGGTYRMDVQGGVVSAQRAFTRTCIRLPRGSGAGMLMITHLLDPVPTEAHVHWSLWAEMPMFVLTPPDGVIWTVEEGAIRNTGQKAGD